MPTSFGTEVASQSTITAAFLNSHSTAINNCERDLPSWGGTATGSANAYAVTLSPAPSAYTDVHRVVFVANFANTGAATLNVNGLGAKNIKKQGGVALVSADIPNGALVEVYYDGTEFLLPIPVGANISVTGAATGKGHYSNLIVKPDATAPNTKLNLSADSVVVATGTNTLAELLGLSLSCDATTTGAGGLDTGALAASTWYYLYVIHDGTTPALLLSTNASSPTMPGGYTYLRRVAAVVTDGSAHFLPFHAANGFHRFLAHQQVLSGGASGTYASVSLASFVPPSAVVAQLDYIFTGTGTGTGDVNLSVDGTAVFQDINFGYAAGTYVDYGEGSMLVPLPTAQTIWYKVASNSASCGIWVQGFLLNL